MTDFLCSCLSCPDRLLHRCHFDCDPPNPFWHFDCDPSDPFWRPPPLPRLVPTAVTA